MIAKKKASIGLAKEHPLPQSFTAKTDLENEKVEIGREGYEPITISMNSYASVSNVLTMLWDGTALQPGSSLEIKDVFTGKSTTVTANAMVDVARVLTELATSPGKYLPESDVVPEERPKPKRFRRTKAEIEADERAERLALKKGKPQETAAPSDGKEQDQPKSEEPKTSNVVKMPAKKAEPKKAAAKKAETQKAAGKKTETQKVASKKAAPTVKAEKAAKPPKAKTQPAAKPAKKVPAPASPPISVSDIPAPPAWFTDSFLDKYEGGSQQSKFELIRTPLALQSERSRIVAGKAGEVAGPLAWGYEVLSKDKHVAWVIAENERALVITGIPGETEKPQPQRLMDGVIARIIARAMPKFKAASKAA